MRCALRLVALVCMTAWWQVAAGVDAPHPILDLAVSDGPRLIQHVHASIYGRLWSSPACAGLRAKVAEAVAQAQKSIGFDPLAAAASLVSARLVIMWPGLAGASPAPGTPSVPDIHLEVDVGAQATAILHGVTAACHLAPVAIPGADEAVLLSDGRSAWARFGTVLAVGDKDTLRKPPIVPVHEHDISLFMDGAALAAALRSQAMPSEATSADRFMAIFAPYAKPIQTDVDVVPDGVHGVTRWSTRFAFLTPVDRSFLGHLPANLYDCSAIGLDGRVLWTTVIKPLLAAFDQENGDPPGHAESSFHAEVAAVGMHLQLADLVAGLSGTTFIALSPGAPVPGFTIGVPRSPALDDVITVALRQMQIVAPAEGTSTSFLIPDMPVSITVMRSSAAWIISTDASFVTTWSAAPSSAWLSTPLGALFTSKVGPEAEAFEVCDTPAELRAMQGYLAMGMASMPIDAASRQAIAAVLGQSIAHAGLEYQVCTQEAACWTSDSGGMFGGGGISGLGALSIAAGLALPNLLENRVAGHEAAAVAALASRVFPAEVAFQAGDYQDRDGDGVGDYGFFAELAGGPIPGRQDHLTLSLLGHEWQARAPVIDGYRYAVYIPDGRGGALSAADDHPIADCQAGERPEMNFVAYGWPARAGQGRRMFAITAGGTVFVAPFTDGDAPPAWNSMFGGKGWHDPIIWAPQGVHGHAQHRSIPPPAPKPAPKPPGVTDF